MITVPILLAGGEGARLYPLSRPDRPKPYLPLADGKTLLRHAFERALKMAPAKRILAIVPKHQQTLFSETLPEFHEMNIIAEPAGRNTAAAVATGTLAASSRFGEESC